MPLNKNIKYKIDGRAFIDTYRNTTISIDGYWYQFSGTTWFVYIDSNMYWNIFKFLSTPDSNGYNFYYNYSKFPLSTVNFSQLLPLEFADLNLYLKVGANITCACNSYSKGKYTGTIPTLNTINANGIIRPITCDDNCFRVTNLYAFYDMISKSILTYDISSAVWNYNNTLGIAYGYAPQTLTAPFANNNLLFHLYNVTSNDVNIKTSSNANSAFNPSWQFGWNSMLSPIYASWKGPLYTTYFFITCDLENAVVTYDICANDNIVSNTEINTMFPDKDSSGNRFYFIQLKVNSFYVFQINQEKMTITIDKVKTLYPCDSDTPAIVPTSTSSTSSYVLGHNVYINLDGNLLQISRDGLVTIGSNCFTQGKWLSINHFYVTINSTTYLLRFRYSSYTVICATMPKTSTLFTLERFLDKFSELECTQTTYTLLLNMFDRVYRDSVISACNQINCPKPPLPPLPPTPPIIPVSDICFVEGTKIKCDQGEIAIELLNYKKHTIRGLKILCITKTRSDTDYLVCFGKDSLYKSVPSFQTIMSPKHMVLYSGELHQARDFLANFPNVTRLEYQNQILYNVVLEKHVHLVANNMICESLNPKNKMAQIYLFAQNYEKQMNKQNKKTNIKKLKC
jgi:hypothetical protein